MTDFNTDQEYTDYIKGLPWEHLVDISLHLDSDKYPERHRLVQDLIGQKYFEPAEALSADLPDDQIAEEIPKGLVFSRRAYLTLAILGLTALPLFLIRDTLTVEQLFNLFINVGLYTIIYFGLRKRQSWVVTLILFVAYLDLFILFIDFFSVQELVGRELVVFRIGSLILAIFWFAQVRIFSRQATKKYFRESGMTLIGLE